MAPPFVFGGAVSAAGGEAGAARSSPAVAAAAKNAETRSDVETADDAVMKGRFAPRYLNTRSYARPSTRCCSHKCTCTRS